VRRARVATASASSRRISRRSNRRAGRSRARPWARPARTTTATGSSRQGEPSSSTAMRPRRLSRSAVIVGIGGWLLRPSGLLDGFLRVSLDLAVLLGARRPGGKQARRGDLLGTELGLDAGEDPLADVRMLAQERRRVLPSLAEPLLVEAEVGA